MSQPAIILTSKFTAPNQNKNFGKYLGYMSRREALEQKKYLTDDEQAELKRVTDRARQLDVHGKFEKVFDDKKDSHAAKEAKHLLNQKYISELSNEEFGRYLGYMGRISALAQKKANGELTPQEATELKRVTRAAGKISDVHPTKDKVAVGVFSSDRDVVRLEDFQHLRDKLNEGQAAGSIMWQDVVSFDNKFLIKKGILNKETGQLDEKAMRHATKKMMEVFKNQMQPPLNNPYWIASIHRNTDNVHLHFATVEQANRRPTVNRPDKMGNVIAQPKGRRPLSVIDAMKSAFTNDLFDTSELTKEIGRKRDAVRLAVKDAFQKEVMRPEFQKQLNQLMKRLPPSRRDWNYKWFEKHDKVGQNLLDQLTEHLLKDNPDYQQYQKDVAEYEENREAIYGNSKRKSKNYKLNQLKDLRRRNGNALLQSVAKIDKAVEKYRKRARVSTAGNPRNYIQNLLQALKEKEMRKSLYLAPARRKKRKRRSIYLPPIQNRRYRRKLLRDLLMNEQKDLEFRKAHTSLKKRKALSEYEKIQKAVEQSQHGE